MRKLALLVTVAATAIAAPAMAQDSGQAAAAQGIRRR